MPTFAEYAQYYNLLYQDKDYCAESDYIAKTIRRYELGKSRTIVDLGCGAGHHAHSLSKLGYTVHGVDSSPVMIEMATSSYGKSSLISLEKNDIRQFVHTAEVDVIVSMFHVFSYQLENEDLYAVFTNIKRYLKRGGVLIFDFWYGPAVLNEKPEVRTKILENENIKIIRTATPALHENRNVVNVHYNLVVEDKQTKAITNIEENHGMRYFFSPEISMLCDRFEFQLLELSQFLTDRTPLSCSTWNGLAILRNK